MTRSEQNRQAAIDAAIEPIVGQAPVTGLEDMPQNLNGLRARALALTNRLGLLEQFVTAKFLDMSPRLLLAEQTLATTASAGRATADLAAFLEAKDTLLETAVAANTLDIIAWQKRTAATELALAVLQARAAGDEAQLATVQRLAEAAQLDATLARAAASAMQARAEAAADLATKAKAVADTAATAAASAQASLTALASRFRSVRVATTAVAVGGTMTIVVVWPTPFADANYNAVAEFEGLGLLGLAAVVTNRTATGCTISSRNVLGLALLAGAGMVTVTAIHDQV